MRATRFVALPCIISRGGFSEERVFSLTNLEHEGVCSRRHLWKKDGTAVEDGEPPIGQKIDGFVAARVIEVEGDSAMVSVPDGEVVQVAIDQLIERPNSVVGEHVSI